MSCRYDPMFNRDRLRLLRDDMQQALDAVADAHGLSIRVGSASFGPSDATFKVAVAEVNQTDDVARPTSAREAQTYRAMAKLYGLPPDSLGMSFVDRGRI